MVSAVLLVGGQTQEEEVLEMLTENFRVVEVAGVENAIKRALEVREVRSLELIIISLADDGWSEKACFQLLSCLKLHPKLSSIPIMFLTEQDDPDSGARTSGRHHVADEDDDDFSVNRRLLPKAN